MATIRTVTIRSKAKAGNLDDLSIEPFGISMKGAGHNEELQWKSVGSRITSFTIDFNYPVPPGQPTNPFGWPQKTSINDKVDSGPVTVGGGYATAFSYTLSVDLKAKGATHPARTVVIDPEVVVDDQTPPPAPSGGGKKKAAKKKAAKKKAAKKGARRKAARKTGRKKK